MHKTLRIFPIAAIILGTGLRAHAQNPLQLNVGYDVNQPISSFHHFIGNTSYRGWTGGLSYPLNALWSLGLNLGFNDYYQKYGRQVYDQGQGSSISAVLSNSVQTMPLEVKGSFAFTRKGFFRPYVSAGGGVNFVTIDQYLGEYDNPQSLTKPVVTGEAGFLIPIGRYSFSGFRLGAQYNYMPLNYQGISHLDNWGIHAGFVLALH
jgi:hypothetical protein